MISEEEVSKSLTESDHPFLMSDPKLVNSFKHLKRMLNELCLSNGFKKFLQFVD